MVWLNLSPIPVGRRGIIYSFIWFLLVFATRRGGGGRSRRPVSQRHLPRRDLLPDGHQIQLLSLLVFEVWPDLMSILCCRVSIWVARETSLVMVVVASSCAYGEIPRSSSRWHLPRLSASRKTFRETEQTFKKIRFLFSLTMNTVTCTLSVFSILSYLDFSL